MECLLSVLMFGDRLLRLAVSELLSLSGRQAGISAFLFPASSTGRRGSGPAAMLRCICFAIAAPLVPFNASVPEFPASHHPAVTLPQGPRRPPMRARQSSQISGPRLTFREQLVGRFVQTLLLAARIRQMTN
jgi:hypothetical protein